jgi:uncharacterized repeat protein (TIGR01451 family)
MKVRANGSWKAFVVVSIVASTVIVATAPAPVDALVARAFGIRYQVDTNGAIDIFGNTLLTCPVGSTSSGGVSCVNTQNPSGTNNVINNAFTTLTLVDADNAAGAPDSAATTNSSGATVTIPSGSTIRFAGLYWGARSTSSTRNQISFRAPGQTTYANITASQLDSIATGNLYQGFADVTSRVQTSGAGVYWAGNIRATAGTNDFAGWALVVVYENAALPLRNLTVFDGYGLVQNTTADKTLNIPLSGFLTPPFGTVNVEVGVVAYEGDGGTTGDQFLLNNVALTDAQNPANDFFNASISTGGVNDLGRTPQYKNTLGFDADEVSATGLIANSATSATVTLTTNGDAYNPGVVTTAIDLYAPVFPETTKTVVDVNGGTAKIGETLRYSVAMTNVGLDPALNSVIRDAIPAGVTYVPGSIKVNGATVSDVTDTDVGQFDGTQVQAFVGVGATSLGGGTIGPNVTATLQFDVVINSSSSGTTISNQATLAYRAQTLSKDFTFRTNVVDTPVDPRADLQITKTATPSPFIAGSPATYVLTVRNNGPNPSTGVNVTDALPAGFSPATATPSQGGCSVTGGIVSCALGAVAVGATATVSVTVPLAPAMDPTTVLTNTATVIADVFDPVSGNDASTVSADVDAIADLRVSKSATPSPATPGSTVTYTVTATNDGPSTANAVQVSEALPTQLLSSTVTPGPGGSCSGTSCTFPSLNPGASATVTITGTVAPSATGSIVNTAAVSSATPDNDSSDNSTTITTPLAASANLSVTKTASPSPAAPGSSVTYTVVVANSGPSDASAVTLTDTLPTLTAVTAVTTTGSCTGTATVTCALGTVPAGGSATITIAGTVPIAQTANLSNTATATSPTPDPVTGNNTTTISTPVAPSADLILTKTANPNPVTAGGAVSYTVTISNNGASTATSVALTDVVPNQLNGVTVTSPTMTCSLASRTATCTLASLAPGNSAVVTITGNVPAGQVGALTANTATVTSATTDPNTANNTATVVTNVATIADLQVTKSVAPTSVDAGLPATWTVNVSNAGPSVAGSFDLVDTLPAGLTPTSALIGGSPCAIVSQTVTCSSIGLGVGASVTVLVTTAVADGAAAGTVSNTAALSNQTTTDPTASNNAATASLTVTQSADLTIAKAAITNPITPGLPATFTLTVDNAGPSDASGAVSTDALPTGYTLAPGTDSRCLLVASVVSCNLGVILADAAAEVLTIVVVPPPNAPAGSLTNVATIASSTPDPTPGSTSSVTVPVSPVADVSVSKIDAVDPVVAGETERYTITVSNAGPSDATGVTLSDPGLSALTGITLTPSQGTCSIATRTCALGTITPASTVTVTVVGTVPVTTSPGVDVLSNTATVNSVADSTPGNNTSTATTTVVRSADLSIAKSATPTTAVAGDPVTWTITVTNHGPSLATAVTVTDSLPTALVAGGTTATTSAGTCGVPITSVTCDVGTVLPGATVTITVIGQIDPASTVTSVTNTASASAADPDDNSADNAATVTVPVVNRADLTITKNASNPAPVAGETLTWVIQVVNHGPSTARNVMVTDTLPTNFTATSVLSAPSGCTALPCSFGDVPIGAIRTITLIGTVAPSATAPIANTTGVTTDTNDPNPTDNVATETIVPQALADLTITKSPLTTSFTAGGSATWTITVDNAGPSDATGVTVTDVLPTTGFSAVTLTPSQGTCPTTTTCNLGIITAAQAPAVITVTGTISAAYAGATIVNRATAASATSEIDPLDNTVTSTVPVAPVADLAIVKTALNQPFVPGAPVTWRIQVTNNGPSNATGIQVTDSLPTGTTITSATVSSGTCTGVGSASLACNLGALNAGVTRTVTVVADLAADVDPGTLSNTATVTASTPDPNPSNNTSSASATVVGQADVSVVKAFTGSVVAGSPVSWTLTVSNAGPSDATNVVTTDVLPPGVTVSSPPAGCTGTTTLTCSVANLADGASTVINVTGLLSPDARGTLSNTATTSSEIADPDPTDNGSTASRAITVTSGVTIDKVSPSPVPVPGGGPGRWSISLTNAGPSTANGVAINDPISGVTGVTLGSAATAGSCSTAVVCTIGDLPPGATVSVLIDVAYPASEPAGLVSNTATVTATSPLTGTLTDTASFLLAGSADVSISKTFSPATITAGQPGTYVLTVANVGPSDAIGVAISDPLPVGVASASLGAGAPSGCSILTAPLRLACSGLTVAAGSSADITINIVSSGTLGAGDLDNTATFTAGTTDPDSANNAASVSPVATNSADVDLTKTVSAGPHVAGAATVHTWTITAANAGPSTAVGVVLSDAIPAGVTVTGVTPSPACAVSTGLLTCAPVNIVSGGSTTVTVSFTIDPDSAAGPIVNSATSSATTPDPGIDNNTAQVAFTVERDTTVSITKTADPPIAVAGESVVWTIAGTVAGPSTAEAASVSDTVPEGFAVTAATLSINGGATTPCTVAGRLVSCGLGTRAPADTFEILIAADIDPALADGGYTNTAHFSTITPGGSASVDGPVTIGRSSPIRVTKTSIGTGPFLAGEPLDFTVTVTNPGPSTAENVTFVERSPLGYVVSALEPSQGACPGIASCDLGTIPVGGAVTITVRGAVAPDAPAGTITNAVDVSADDVAAPVTATGSAIVIRQAALRFSKAAAPVVVTAGEAITYTLTLVNDGPSTAENVVVTESLPPGFTPGSAVASSGSYVAPTWTIPVLAPGSTATLAIPGVVDSAYTGPDLTNAATLTSDTPNSGDTQAAVTTPVLVDADVIVTKTTATTPIVAGGAVSWTITVANLGSSDARDVVVTDQLPIVIVPGTETITVSPPTAATCSAATVSCDFGTIVSGAPVATITVSGTLAPDTPDGFSLVNAVSATTSTPETNAVNTATSVGTVTTVANLVITKRVITDPLVAGAPATYEITVTNPGPSDALDVQIIDTPPASMIGAAATSPGATCGGLTCDVSTLAAGSTVIVTVSGVLDASIVDATNLTNLAEVTSPTDPGSGSRTVTTTNPVTTSADLEVVKVVTTPPVAGEGVVWTVTVTNRGPSDAQDVVITETAPTTQITGITYTPTIGTCTAIGVCTIDPLPAGRSVTITVTGRVPAGLADGTLITNAVSATTSTADPDLADNEASIDTTVTALADLAITKVGPSSVTPGQLVTWTITVDNTAGPSDARNVVVDDVLPTNVGPATISSSQGGCIALPCSLGTLLSGATATVTITATVDQATLLDVTNRATVISDTDDTDPANNAAAVTSVVTPRADVAITKVLDTNPVVAGSPVSWTILVANTGPSQAVGVQVTDTPPSNVDSVTATIGAGAGACSGLVCDLAPIPAGATVAIVVAGTLRANAAAGSTIANTAVISAASTADSNTANNTFTTTPAAVTRSADVSVTKTLDTSPIIAGRPLTWTITATNAGPSDAQAVELVDLLPTAVTGAVLTPSSGSCVNATGTCTFGVLQPGDVVTVVVTADVPSDLDPGTTLSNAVTVTSATADPDPSDNAVSTPPATVTTVADLAIDKVGPITAVPGTAITWTIVITNDGPSDARDVVVSDVIPAAIVSPTVLSTQAGCTTLPCTLGTIPNGGSARISISGLIDPASLGPLVNTATVEASTPDPTTIDLTDSVTTGLTARADVSIVKSIVTNPVVAGEPVTWTFAVANAGPSESIDVQVNDTLPAGATIISIDDGACAGVGTADLVCNYPNRPPGSLSVITVIADLAADVLPGPFDNTVAISSATTDPDLSDNSSTAAADSTASADLQLVKTITTDPVVAGESIGWSLTIRNDGPSDAQNVTISDPIPAGVTLNFPLTPGCLGATTVVCTRSSLAAGATTTFTITGTLSPDARGTLTNTASVASDTPDPAGPNSSTDTAPIVVTSQLTLAKTAPSPVPVPGGAPGRWTITVTNDGPSTANGVAVSDTVGVGSVIGAASTVGVCDLAVRCVIGDLPPGATITILIDVEYPADTPTGIVSNTATVTADTPLTGALGATADFDLQGLADLQARKTLNPDPMTGGTSGQYVVSVTNAGPSDALDVAISDVLPPGVAASSLVSGPAGCVVAANRLTCTGLTVAAAATIDIVIGISAQPTLGAGDLDNSVGVISATADPDSTNNTSTVTPNIANSADLVVDKTVSPGPYVAGGATVHQWTIVVRNDGPSAAVGVVLTDTLSAGITIGTVSDGALTCGVSGRDLSCAPFDLADGDEITIVIPFTIDATTAAGPLVNSATATSPTTPDPSNGNNDADVSILVDRQVAISLTKSGPTNVVAGTNLTWVISGTAEGPSTAEFTSVSDTLPLGFTPVMATSSGASPCSVAGRLVSCLFGTLDPGESFTVTIIAGIDPTQADGNVTNTANASSITPGGSVSAAHVVTVGRVAPVSVTKVPVGSGPFVAGTPMSWLVTVTNPGPSTSENVIVTELAPSAFAVTALAPSQGTCVGVASCLLGTIPVGASARVRVTGTIDPAAAAATMTNGVSVDTDEIPAPVAASGAVDVTRSASLNLAKVAAPDSARAGERFTWTLTVTNEGPSTSENVVVTDDIPSALLTPAVTPSIGTYDAGTDRWTVGTLLVGQSVTMTITGRLDPAYVAADIVNDASLTSTTPNPGDATATATTPVVVEADVRVTKRIVTDPLVAGRPVQWAIDVTNDGPATAVDVVVTDSLPGTVTGGSLSIDPSEGSCVGLACLVLTLQPGQTVTISVNGDLVATAALGSTVSNAASVSSSTPDPDISNNAAAALPATVTTAADLTVEKVAVTDPIVAGADVTWTITVNNVGPSAALGVRVDDLLPAELVATSVVLTSLVGTCDATGCDLGTLDPGASVVISLTGAVASDAPHGGLLVNTATVTSETADPDRASNTSTTSDIITRSADLDISLAGPVTATPGTAVTWTIALVNHGPSDADNVAVTFPVPPGITIGALDPLGPCVLDAGVVTCTLAQLPSGASRSFELIGSIDAAATQPILVSAAAGSSTSDPQLANNVAAARLALTPSADVSIVKTGPTAPIAGATAVWTIVISNAGPSTAVNVVATDTLDPSLGAATVSDIDNACTVAAGTVTCTWPALGPGASKSVTIRATVSSSYDEASLANTASVRSDTPDPDSSNNGSTAVSQPAGEYDLSIVKTVGDPSIPYFGTTPFTLTVRNNGPSVARNVIISDLVPAGLTVISVSAGCTFGAQSVLCAVADLKPGDSAASTVVVRGNVPGTWTNCASVGGRVITPRLVESLNTDRDANATNNEACVDVVVEAAAELVVTKTTTTTTAATGDVVEWVVTVRNLGPSAASDVTVVEAPDAGSTIVSVSPSVGTYDPTRKTWKIATLAAGATATLTVRTTMSTGGAHRNQVSVQSATADASVARLGGVPRPIVGSASGTINITVKPIPVTGTDPGPALRTALTLSGIGLLLLIGTRRRRRHAT